MISVHEDDPLWCLDPKRFSSWTKLIRVQAWVRRFIDNCRSPNRERGELKAEEIEDAAILVIRGAQRKAFPDEYLACSRLSLVGRENRGEREKKGGRTKASKEGLLLEQANAEYLALQRQRASYQNRASCSAYNHC